jgi:hypothetical protein
VRSAFLAAALLLSAVPASASCEVWNCFLQETYRGVTFTLQHSYFGPGEPIGAPLLMFNGAVDGVRMSGGWYGDFKSLNSPFAAPGEFGFEIPVAASRRAGTLTLSAPGQRPLTFKVPRRTGRGFSLGGPNWIPVESASVAGRLLSVGRWTAVQKDKSRRVQLVHTLRFPISLREFESVRNRQFAQMREMARDPRSRCTRDSTDEVI